LYLLLSLMYSVSKIARKPRVKHKHTEVISNVVIGYVFKVKRKKEAFSLSLLALLTQVTDLQPQSNKGYASEGYI